jgi:hypothetical protein
MNERIKELHNQAFKETKDYYATMQKFAELIVKECIEISQVGSITESKLKKHFGVE